MSIAPVRTSIIGDVHIRTLLFSPIILFGDALLLAPTTNVIAVQRQIPEFLGDEGNFDAFPMFRFPMPEPPPAAPVSMTVDNRNPFILVGSVNLTSVAFSSIVQAGSNRCIVAENRVKHIRQLLPISPSGRPPSGSPLVEPSDGTASAGRTR